MNKTFLYPFLTEFALNPEFESILVDAFGTEIDLSLARTIQQQWQEGDFSLLPSLEILSPEIMPMARGAYARSRQTIYFNEQWLNSASQSDIVAVYLEELGHHLDNLLNQQDTPGDEGKLFAAKTLGIELTSDDVVYLRLENDSATIILDGEEVAIKMSSGFMLPIRNNHRISSGYGWRNLFYNGVWRREFHEGLDFAAPTGTNSSDFAGTPVYASRGGKVIVSKDGWNGGYGSYIIVDHEDGYTTYYAHLSSRNVNQGQRISQGHHIGGVGTTGRSTGNHLHFEIRLNNKSRDPDTYLNGSPPPQPPPVTNTEDNILINYPVFDAVYYLAHNQDVAAAVGSTNYDAAKAHWLRYGITDGRKSSPFLDVSYYLASNQDVAAAYGATDYQRAINHWLRYGITEGRRASAEFDPIYYMAANPDVEAAYGSKQFAGAMLFQHSVARWDRLGSEILTDYAVFDIGYYLANNNDVAQAINPDNLAVEVTRHWLNHGIKEGRRGSAEFDPVYYMAAHPDVEAAYARDYSGDRYFQGAIRHYVVHGKPGAWAGSQWVTDPDVFSWQYYLANNSDVAAVVNPSKAAVEATRHWYFNGINEGRRGNVEFDSRYYLARWEDVRAVYGANNYRQAMDHYLIYGKNDGRIGSNDEPRYLSINDMTLYEGNSGSQNAIFTVTLNHVHGHTITVNYGTANDSAGAGSDYQGVSGTLTFNPGETSKTISVPVYGDVYNEDDERFFLNLSSPSNASLSRATGFGTIFNDDPAPNITINDQTITEGNSGIQNMTFTVSLSERSNKTITVNYATANDSAIAGSDYNAVNGTLTFTPGETSKTITVAILGDTISEDNERFLVNLSGASNGNITDSQSIGTINDNDGTPTITINDVTITESDSGSQAMNFTVSLSNPSSKAVSVAYNTDYIYNARKYTLTNGAKTWEDAQSEALQMGGNLVTINSAEEEQWLQSIFGTSQQFLIGLYHFSMKMSLIWHR